MSSPSALVDRVASDLAREADDAFAAGDRELCELCVQQLYVLEKRATRPKPLSRLLERVFTTGAATVNRRIFYATELLIVLVATWAALKMPK